MDMHSREGEEMMDRLDRDDDYYFPSVEWPFQQSTWRASSKSLVCRLAVSDVPDAGEASVRFVRESYNRPLVLRPAVSGVPNAGETSSQVVQEKCIKPLVHRPAVHGFLAVEETSPQVVKKNRTMPLVLRPAIPEVPILHDIAEQKRTMQLQSTLPHRPRVTDKSRDSRRRYKQSLRKWIELKRQLEQRKRRSGSESRESNRFENSYHEIDPAIIGQRILDSPVDYSHAVRKEEDEWHKIVPKSETKGFTDTLISALVSEMMKEKQHVYELKDFVSKEHTLEEWQDWGRIRVERMDKKKKNWEEYREIRKKGELRDYGGSKIDESMKGEWSREPLSIQSVYYFLNKLDRVLEEAEKRLPKTHCGTKKVESESAKQSAAKREKAQFVKTHVRAYVDSDDDDPSAMRPAKCKQLPLRMQK